MLNRPLYTIGVVADLLDVHPETLRVWERHGLVSPHRRNGQRLYADNDLKRLAFIQELLSRGLNIAGVTEYLSFYPCWLRDECPSCVRKSTNGGCGKPCWKEKGVFCQVTLRARDTCKACEYRQRSSADVVANVAP